MKDWKSDLGFDVVKHEPEGSMPIYLVREDGADDREATITERVLWDSMVNAWNEGFKHGQWLGKNAAPVAPAEPASEPVATLHDDGCFTWKRDDFRRKYDRHRAGWRMDVYPGPQPAPVRVPLTNGDLLALWGQRSDGPDNREIVSYARAVLAAAGITPAKEAGK